MAKYTIIIEKGDRNYSAYCPDIPGVVAAGETEEETEELIKEAIELHLDGLKEEISQFQSRQLAPEAFKLLFRGYLLILFSSNLILCRFYC
jgi:predicted RNase H-like HicB family nuclease